MDGRNVHPFPPTYPYAVNPVGRVVRPPIHPVYAVNKPQMLPVYNGGNGSVLTASFTANDLQLNRHVATRRRRRTFELDRRFVCFNEDCGRRYASQSALYAHMRIKHMFVRPPKDSNKCGDEGDDDKKDENGGDLVAGATRELDGGAYKRAGGYKRDRVPRILASSTSTAHAVTVSATGAKKEGTGEHTKHTGDEGREMRDARAEPLTPVPSTSITTTTWT